MEDKEEFVNHHNDQNFHINDSLIRVKTDDNFKVENNPAIDFLCVQKLFLKHETGTSDKGESSMIAECDEPSVNESLLNVETNLKLEIPFIKREEDFNNEKNQAIKEEFHFFQQEDITSVCTDSCLFLENSNNFQLHTEIVKCEPVKEENTSLFRDSPELKTETDTLDCSLHISRLFTLPEERPYTCKICSKSFKHLSLLKAHEGIHSEERPYTCKTCAKSFKRKRDLQVHEYIHSEKKPHTCKICSKSFKQKHNLQKHEHTHSEERPFTCKICSKSFKLKGTLTVHERTHSTERPYTCKICSKSFKQKVSLQYHKSSHSTEKPYTCTVCSKSYKLKHDLQAHERTHLREH